MSALLEARGLAIAGRLASTDLKVKSGELVALVGPNGGGKTSLLRAIAGVEDAGGEVRIDGSVIGRRRPGLMSLMAASRDIGWPIPVRDVVMLGLPGAANVGGLLERFELTEHAARPVNGLSTGERARVLMARAIAPQPRLLLLDEPLSNLDPYWVLHFLDAMRGHAATGAAVLCALHDLSLIDRFDRVLMIAGGAVNFDGTPARLVASPCFTEIFRVVPAPGGGWQFRPPAGPRSSQ